MASAKVLFPHPLCPTKPMISPRSNDHGNSVLKGRGNSGERILVDQVDEGLLFPDDLLDLIKIDLALALVRRGGLRFHQTVNFCFPGSRWRFLLRVPLMIAG